MKEDAYNKILKIMQSEGARRNPSSLILGEVISKSPIAVKYGDLQLIREDLLINKSLLTYPDGVETLDKETVVLYPLGQKYLVLCEVV